MFPCLFVIPEVMHWCLTIKDVGTYFSLYRMILAGKALNCQSVQRCWAGYLAWYMVGLAAVVLEETDLVPGWNSSLKFLTSRFVVGSFPVSVFVDLFISCFKFDLGYSLLFLCMPCHFWGNWMFESNNLLTLKIRFYPSLRLVVCCCYLLFTLFYCCSMALCQGSAWNANSRSSQFS